MDRLILRVGPADIFPDLLCNPLLCHLVLEFGPSQTITSDRRLLFTESLGRYPLGNSLAAGIKEDRGFTPPTFSRLTWETTNPEATYSSSRLLHCQLSYEVISPVLAFAGRLALSTSAIAPLNTTKKNKVRLIYAAPNLPLQAVGMPIGCKIVLGSWGTFSSAACGSEAAH